MSHVMKHRWFELRHNPVFWLTLAVCCAFTLFLVSSSGGGIHYLKDPPTVPGITYDMKGFFAASTADCIFPLLIISGTFTAMILSQQFSHRTINQEIAVGHSRGKIFASQCLIGFVVPNLAALLAIVVGCLRWAGSLPMASAAVAVPFFLRALLLLSLLNFSLFSVCMIFVVAFRDTAKTMLFSACFFLAAIISMSAQEYGLSRVPGTLYPVAPTVPLLLHPAFLMRYALYSTLTLPQGILIACVAAGWTALFLSIAYCVFRRCELK